MCPVYERTGGHAYGSTYPGPLAGWTAARDLKAVPRQSFRDWWREREREGGQV